MTTKSTTPETTCVTEDIVRNAIQNADRALRLLFQAGVITLALLISLLLNTF